MTYDSTTISSATLSVRLHTIPLSTLPVDRGNLVPYISYAVEHCSIIVRRPKKVLLVVTAVIVDAEHMNRVLG